MRVAIDEDRGDAERAGRLDVRDRVADEQAVARVRVREVAKSLLEETSFRLAAVALVLVVWTDVESVDARAVHGEVLLQAGVESVDIGSGIEAKSDATLIGDDENAASGAVESSDSGYDAGEQVEFLPVADVGAFGRLAIEHAVAVEENAANIGERILHWRAGGAEDERNLQLV